jgi:hypothetical protein
MTEFLQQEPPNKYQIQKNLLAAAMIQLTTCNKQWEK